VRSNAGPTGLARFVTLNRETPDWTERVYVPAPPPDGGYGPVGVYGPIPSYVDAAPCGPYGCPPYACGYVTYLPGGAVPPGLRPPHDNGRDATHGLAGGIRGASPYRDPGEADGSAHRPGITSGNATFTGDAPKTHADAWAEAHHR
jgi:hypothetical protein